MKFLKKRGPKQVWAFEVHMSNWITLTLISLKKTKYFIYSNGESNNAINAYPDMISPLLKVFFKNNLYKKLKSIFS